MRTKLRSKFTLLLIVCAVLIAVPGAAALAQDTSSPAAPTIQSDKDLYTPGELVTLTGSGWLAGEKVNIFVNDNQGNTWSRNVDVYADASGNISDSFNLPDWFVAVYTVKATGASGAVATTSFSDPTLTVKRGPEGDPPNLKFTVNWQRYTNNTCTTLASGGNTTGSRTIDTDAGNNLQAGTGNVPPGSGGFVKITAPQTPTSPSGYTFDKWETISGTTLDTTNTSADGLAICVRNPGGALNGSYRATYKVSDTTAPVVTLDKVNGTTRTFPYSTNQNVTSVGGSCTNGDGDVSVTLDGNAANPATASCSSGSWSLTLTNALSNEGTYTFSASQTDAASNPGSSGTKPVQIDKTAPNVQCESADADWHANNVSIDCTANDGGSGLNLASDANFSLSTTVAAGNETNNASTGTKDLTDAVGNSATAGPISGNKVDKKAPALVSDGPTTNPNGAGWYKTAVINSFTATDGGSGFAPGGELTHSFNKSSGTNEGAAVKIASGEVFDAVGNSTASIDSTAFKIDLTKPTNIAFQGGPAAGTSYDFGSVPAAPTCTADDALSGLKSCNVSGYSTAVGPTR